MGISLRATEWIEAYGRWSTWTERLPSVATHLLLQAELALATDDVLTAMSRATEALEFSADPRQPLQIMTAHRVLGKIAADQGRMQESRDHLTAALEIAVGAEAPYEQARIKLAIAHGLSWRAATRLRRSSLSNEARTTAESLGAAPLLERIGRARRRERNPA